MVRLPGIALAVLATTLLTSCGDDAPPSTDAGDTSAPPSPTGSATPEVETAPAIDVGTGPVGLTAEDGSAVWVVLSGSDAVARIPVGADEPDLTVEVPGTPLRAVSVDDAVWVTAFRGEQVFRIDAATGEVTDRIATGAGPEGLTAGFGSIWLVEQDAGRLVRIDPTTRKVVSRTDIGVGARLPHAGSKAVYVAAFADDRVLRIDPGTLDVRRSTKVCSGPQAWSRRPGSSGWPARSRTRWSRSTR